MKTAEVEIIKPGIVVSAGPSLSRNVHLLKRPDLRRRTFIIAVQTVLKPLLKMGIRPHFVMALDHADISARFYEGLTANDVDGVQLIADPRCSPAIVDAFPGRIRFIKSAFLDSLLGTEGYRDRGELQPGSTVAHMAYYFARFLGCDPVILVGQDLGFTDGQYYSAGASIHNVWSSELNEFRSLEMMEWERVKRMGPHLRQDTDVMDRPIYTDEQMETYKVQFERDFLADEQKGLTTIDATEGGVKKAHTKSEPLASVLRRLLGACMEDA